MLIALYDNAREVRRCAIPVMGGFGPSFESVFCFLVLTRINAGDGQTVAFIFHFRALPKHNAVSLDQSKCIL